MSEESAEYLTTIHELDQDDAELANITNAVARHYAALKGVGMGEDGAVHLCESFQSILMGGNEQTVTLVRSDDDV